jgi:quinol-cytochrome oxidoreductase complex cytochrome b subunit
MRVKTKANTMSQKTLLLLLIDGLSLVGVIVFSVLAALQPDKQIYLIGQIVSVVVILATAIVLQRQRQRTP